MDNNKLNINKESLESLIDKFVENANEERELALERYRRQDEMIETPEDFVLQGKNAVDYLKTASERSNSILGAAKLIKDILYNSDGEGASSGGMSDDMKKEILKQIRDNE